MDAVGIGVAVRDLTARLSAFPAPDSKSRAREFAESGGGPVPTALVTLSRLGRRTALVSVWGDDAAGSFLAGDLRREGVDVSRTVVRQGLPTPSSLILVEGSRRTIVECFSAQLPLGPQDVGDLSLWRDCRFLLVDARFPGLQIDAARRARAAGALVVLDCGHPRPGVSELLPLTDVAILSHTYPLAVDGEGYDRRRFLEQLASRLAPGGPRLAGLTLGAEGCALLSPAGLVEIPAHPVEVVDTTGAGDVFHGAFVHALWRGDPPESAARFANAAAALKCRGLTGRAALASESEIRRRAGLG